MLVIPTVGKLRQEDYEFQACIDYIVRPCLEKLVEVVAQSLIPALGRKGQEGVSEFEARLVYKASSKIARATQRNSIN